MKVRLLVGRVGDGFSQVPGQVIEVEAAEAKRMIEADQAVPATKKAERADGTQGEQRGDGETE